MDQAFLVQALDGDGQEVVIGCFKTLERAIAAAQRVRVQVWASRVEPSDERVECQEHGGCAALAVTPETLVWPEAD